MAGRGSAGHGMEYHLMSPFKPKGEIAQWRIVYDAFRTAATGTTVTYQHLAEALDMDHKRDRHRIQAAARRAMAQLLDVDKRAVEVQPETGYVMVSAARQIPMAGKQIERATHHLDRGRDLTTNVAFDELTDRERSLVQAMTLGFAQVGEYVRQMETRIVEHDGELQEHAGRLADIEAELVRLREAKPPA